MEIETGLCIIIGSAIVRTFPELASSTPSPTTPLATGNLFFRTIRGSSCSGRGIFGFGALGALTKALSIYVPAGWIRKEGEVPFVKQEPRPFTREVILKITGGQEGVYGLLKGKTWIYVGMGDIRQRLLDHVGGDNACITEQRPTHWVAETGHG